MRLTAFVMLIGGLASPLAAQDILGPEAFERYTTGKTLTYSTEGMVYGAEQYLPNRRVIWAFVGKPCKYGTWYPRDEEICFVYDTDPDAHCWTFFQTGSGLRAQFSGDPPGAALVELAQSTDPLVCPGPDVGV